MHHCLTDIYVIHLFHPVFANNFSEFDLPFCIMNLGMMAPAPLNAVEESYCVDAVLQLQEKRAAVIDGLNTKTSVLALGK